MISAALAIIPLLFLNAVTGQQQATAKAQSSKAAKPAANSVRLKHWQDSRFGMFIHWGPVSLKGTEIGWSRGSEVPIDEYDTLYTRFNPVKFDADRWVQIAQDAGMKYIVFTTKHHDGFCMFNTKQTDHNIMNSPFGRDVVGELADACKRHGMPFGCYYSVTDWHHPDFPLGSPGGSTRKPNPNLNAYEEYLRKQVAELITNYGPLNTIWFDVPQEVDAKRGKGIVDYVRSLQPDILINNRCSVPADYDTPEQTVGRFQRNRPWESCITICQQWSFKSNDTMKSVKECVETLVRCSGGDGNLLFNVGPTPLGEIEDRQAARLHEMGLWLKRYGKTVYGTRGGPFKPGAWGCATSRGSSIFLHVMHWPEGGLELPSIPGHILKSASITGRTFTLKQTDNGIHIVPGPAISNSAIDDIVELRIDGRATDIAPLYTGSSLTTGKHATASNVFRGLEEYSASAAVDGDDGSRWATDRGTHSAWLQVDLASAVQVGRVHVVQEADYALRIKRWQLEVRDDEKENWNVILAGTTMTPDYNSDIKPITARFVRLNIVEATEGPTISEFQLFAPK